MPDDRHASPEFARRIHKRLLSGDPVASAEFARVYMEPLVRYLRRRHPEVNDETLAWDAATNAVLDYAENPSSFDPKKSGLFGYLKMASHRDLLNALEKERRRGASERSAGLRAVELSPGGGKELQRDEDVERVGERTELDEERSQRIMEKVYEALPDPRDRRMLELMMDEVRETEAFAEVLGIRDRDEAEQRKTVKRHKDRIKKRVQRLGLPLRG
jgi:RNA polymerase sigma-70 factor (ECF subfamily)